MLNRMRSESDTHADLLGQSSRTVIANRNCTDDDFSRAFAHATCCDASTGKSKKSTVGTAFRAGSVAEFKPSRYKATATSCDRLGVIPYYTLRKIMTSPTSQTLAR